MKLWILRYRGDFVALVRAQTASDAVLLMPDLERLEMSAEQVTPDGHMGVLAEPPAVKP